MVAAAFVYTTESLKTNTEISNLKVDTETSGVSVFN